VCQCLSSDASVNSEKRPSVPTIANTLGTSHEFVKSRFGVLFEYRVVGFVKELVTIAALPLVVYYALYRRADTFASFIIRHTIVVEGVGNCYADMVG